MQASINIYNSINCYMTSFTLTVNISLTTRQKNDFVSEVSHFRYLEYCIAYDNDNDNGIDNEIVKLNFHLVLRTGHQPKKCK